MCVRAFVRSCMYLEKLGRLDCSPGLAETLDLGTRVGKRFGQEVCAEILVASHEYLSIDMCVDVCVDMCAGMCRDVHGYVYDCCQCRDTFITKLPDSCALSTQAMTNGWLYLCLHMCIDMRKDMYVGMRARQGKWLGCISNRRTGPDMCVNMLAGTHTLSIHAQSCRAACPSAPMLSTGRSQTWIRQANI